MRPPFLFETAAPAPPPALLRRFDRCASRNPALPPLAEFSPAFGARELHAALAQRRREHGPARRLPLHLLVNMPSADCLESTDCRVALAAEASTLAHALGAPERVERITFVPCGEAPIAARDLGELLARIARQFQLDAAQVGIEARWPGLATLRAWREAGVSCLVLDRAGAAEVEAAQRLGLGPVTIRIPCGRGGRDGARMDDELPAILRAGASRIQLQGYASTLEAACDRGLPPTGPIALFEDRGVARAAAIGTLLAHGLRHVGRGLFARADDPCVGARERGRLHLEVDGFAPGPVAGTLAIGAGAFGRLGTAYYRNAGGAREHALAVALHGLAAAAGVALSRLGQARRAAVASLVCHGRLDFEAIALAHLVEPRHCFARELRELAPLARAGLVEMDGEGVELAPQGEHLVDAVVAIFDRGP